MSIEVRSAQTSDIGRICEIVGEALEPEDADEARLVLEDPTFDRQRWLVGLIDDTIVSTLVLVDSELRVGETNVSAGQIEFVATDESARGQGLIRAQMEEAHRRSAAAGHVAQFIVGIPNFYRQFGYSYAVHQPAYQHVGNDVVLEGRGKWDFRPARDSDIPAIVAAQRLAQADATVALTHTAAMWRWLIESPNYDVLVAENKGQLAVGRVYEDGDTAFLGDVVAPAKGALHGMIAEARHTAPDVAVINRTDQLVTAMLSDLGPPLDELGWYYVRVADPGRFLNELRPELTRRIRDSALADYNGQLIISMYRSSLSSDVAGGVPGHFAESGPVPYPVSSGASGISGDLMPDLLLGPLGARELERRNGDVLLGAQRDLMSVLFPPMTADIQTWVFP